MTNKFNEALQHLGHVYEPRSEEFATEERVRHVLRVYRPTGDVRARCGSPEPQGIGCAELLLDVNCKECRELESLPPALTKRSLMLDLVNSLCTIEQLFLDAMSWNFHNPDETAINPDPDGELAKGWIEHHQQLIQMMARFEPTMKKHEGRFSWPTDLED